MTRASTWRERSPAQYVPSLTGDFGAGFLLAAIALRLHRLIVQPTYHIAHAACRCSDSESSAVPSAGAFRPIVPAFAANGPLMIRLVYISSLVPSVTDETMKGIVGDAARRNASLSITGILAMEDRKVCQVLEGEEAVVESLFRRISNDRRHEGIVEIARRSIEKRSFPSWSMTRRPMLDVVMMAFS